MQLGKKAAETVKESAANTFASAKAGMEKAKATAKEKVERLTTRDPAEKEAATMEKEERKTQAELNKQEAMAHNGAARRLAESGGPHPGYKTWGTEGHRDYTTAGTEGYVPVTEDYTTTGTGEYTTTTGAGAATVTGDPQHPKGPVRADAPRFDSGATYH